MQLYDLRLTQRGACAPTPARVRRGRRRRKPRTMRARTAGFHYYPDSGGLEHLVGTGVRIPVLARGLQQLVEAIVVDQTDLVGVLTSLSTT